MNTATTKHTPGPWWPVPQDKDIGIYFNDVDGEYATVASIPLAGDIAEANARLIAAAPELLVALQNMCDDSHCHIQALEAIAKATGGDA